MITDNHIITNSLNDYFINIGNSLASKIQPEPIPFASYLSTIYKNSFALTPTDLEEVTRITTSLQNKNSYGHDGIPINIVKASIVNICKPLSAIINSSMSEGCFPDLLKIARVCPIFKAGDKSDVANYHPISILTSFSKIFEKVMYNRLISYLDYNKILHPAQYGFRKNHSTYMALLDLYNRITTATDNNEYAIGIFVDLSKAFDTINHDILLRKLWHYGIRGITLDWFTSYLSNRKQFVTLNDVNSAHRTISTGVPQGSVLGPLLFILFVNDIVNSSRLLHFILFADDTNLFYSCRNLELLLTTVNLELCKLATWFRANKLSLNVNKTNFIMFGRKRLSCGHQTVKIDDVLLTQVESTKFLGVHIDAKTTWKDHIAYISLKISRSLGAINRVKRILPQKILLLLYYTMVYPYLSYCCIVWGCASACNLQSLRILQKRALRIVTNSFYLAPSVPIFAKLKLLKLDDIFTFQTAQFMGKFKLNLLPDSCKSYFTVSNTDRPHHTRKTSYFTHISCRTHSRQNS